MSEELSSYTVHDLYTRYIAEAEYCSGDLLAKMEKDPRNGVQMISQKLTRRREEARKEKDRLEQMMHFERRFWSSGLDYVAGVDEAGIGPLAGPVVSAAVVFRPSTRIEGVNDSKRLSPVKRAVLASRILEDALSVSIGISEVEEIDRINVYQSGLLSMKRAVLGLSVVPGALLVDGRVVPGLPMPQRLIVKGDRRSFSIAAASIIAKTHRDQIMRDLDRQYPGYGFAAHKGYGTSAHREALRKLGPAAPHRRSFSLIPESPPGLFNRRGLRQHGV
jgi:ribonuclease HII